MNRLRLSQSRWMSALAAFLFALSLLQAVGQQPVSPVASAKEQDIKSAFLFNFLKYVEWPHSCFGQTNSPLIVGVCGSDPISSHLEKIARGRTIGGRPLEIRSLTGSEKIGETHVLWVGSSQGKQQEEWLRAAAGKNVLTIGETDLFAQKGGIITFFVEGDKVRFDINMKAARNNGVMVRAQLQKLARKLHRSDE